ncbi:MAG: DUF1489 family protein [Pseudorhodoplanes sp.]|nr:DUF1489 family protein [Pseudorhodoplanes sp.]
MPLHLLKLSVGTESVDELQKWIRAKMKERKKKGQKAERIHTTRMVPKRIDELLDGGSIYWVIRGQIMCRERLIDIRPFVDKDGIGRCHLVLDPEMRSGRATAVPGLPGLALPSREDAPRDLDRSAPGLAAMPEPMRRELRELGLI